MQQQFLGEIFCDFATNSLLFNCPRFTAHGKQEREFVSRPTLSTVLILVK